MYIYIRTQNSQETSYSAIRSLVLQLLCTSLTGREDKEKQEGRLKSGRCERNSKRNGLVVQAEGMAFLEVSLSHHPRPEEDPVSKTLCFLVFRIPDMDKFQKACNSEAILRLLIYLHFYCKF
jgi:hypothetical protein